MQGVAREVRTSRPRPPDHSNDTRDVDDVVDCRERPERSNGGPDRSDVAGEA